MAYTNVGLVLVEKYTLIIRITAIKNTLWLIFYYLFLDGGGIFLKSLLFHMWLYSLKVYTLEIWQKYIRFFCVDCPMCIHTSSNFFFRLFENISTIFMYDLFNTYTWMLTVLLTYLFRSLSKKTWMSNYHIQYFLLTSHQSQCTFITKHLKN